MNIRFARYCFVFLAVSGVFVLAPGVFADTLGEQRTFNVDAPFDVSGRSSLWATLREISNRSYGYVEDTYYASLDLSGQGAFLDSLRVLLSHFDNDIYPKVTGLFGPLWEPGIDNDPRITVLFEQLAGSFGGYINTADEYPKAQIPRSNEREMAYINTGISSASRLWWSVLAHEFTHLVVFFTKDKSQNIEEDLWLNELYAEYGSFASGAETPLQGSHLQSRLSSFRATPSDSLTEFLGQSQDYGMVATFAQYFAGRFGEDALALALKGSTAGIVSLNESLQQEQGNVTFEQAFRDFLAAAWLDDASLGPAYHFANPEITPAHVKPTQPTYSFIISPGQTLTLGQFSKDWAGQWVKFTGSGGQTLEVTVQGSAPMVAALLLTRSDNTKSVVVSPQASAAHTLRAHNFGTSVTEATLAFAAVEKTTGFTQNEPHRSWNLSAQLVPQAPFSISVASPRSIVSFGGTPITLSGEGFSNNLTLSVGGKQQAYTFVDVSTIQFIAPVLSPGSVCLKLENGPNQFEDCGLLSAVSFSEGSLVRASNDYRVYIVKGQFLRHIVSSEIFNFYGHLSFANVTVVDPVLIPQYRASAWVRADEDARVYEVNGDGSKHWMNMTAEQFVISGHSWEGVYVINTRERDWYSLGAEVLFQ